MSSLETNTQGQTSVILQSTLRVLHVLGNDSVWGTTD